MNLEALLLAIAMVESNCNDLAVGKLGEVSRYQIRPHIFRVHAPLRRARDSVYSSAVARVLLNDLSKQLHTTNILLLAAAWNYGPSRLRKANFEFFHLPKTVQSYAIRVDNLYTLYAKFTPTKLLATTVPRGHVSSLRSNDKSVRGRTSSAKHVASPTQPKRRNNLMPSSRQHAKSARKPLDANNN